MKIRNLLLLLVISVSGPGISQAQAETLCDSVDQPPPHFTELYQQARELGREICLSFGDSNVSDQVQQRFVAFAQTAAQSTATAFAATDFADDMVIQMQHFEALARAGIEKKNLPSFITIGDTQNLDEAVFFRFSNWNTQGYAVLDDAGCMQSGGASCEQLFDSLKIAIEQYKKPFVNLSGKDLAARAEKLMAEWDRYFEQARAQTLWDAVLTTKMEQDHLAQSRLVGPMEKQWFVLHPSIVIENVSAAADGDELSEAFAIEWIGINWWDKQSSPVGYPIGISLASVYSDRAEVEDVGHGVMLHIGNSMSIGWTDHDGDTGISVTVDLLSFMARKKQHWESFKKELETIVEQEKKKLLN